MSIDRFHPFTDSELHEIRYGLLSAAANNHRGGRLESQVEAEKLADEIAHVQEQRRMALHREALPG